VSGAEIAWDLDHMGSEDDKAFYNQFLKAEYVYDAPNNQSSTYYSCEHVPGSIFDELSTMTYDNGSNGTYNVSYPDVIGGINGGAENLLYSGLTSNYAGVSFEGLFPDGTNEGKLVNLGFPFETIYPESSRNLLMEEILNFFFPIGPTEMPLVNSPEVYCQYDDAEALAAVGENLLWYSEAVGGTGSPSAIIPDTDMPGTFSYFVSQTINDIESDRAEIVVEIKPRPATPTLTHIGTQLISSFSGVNIWYHNEEEILETNYQYYQPDDSGYFFVKAMENECYSDFSDSLVIEIPLFTASAINLHAGAFPEPISDTCFQSFSFSFEDENMNYNHDFSNFFQNDFSINSNLFETGSSPKNPYLNDVFGYNALMTDTVNNYTKNNFSSIRIKVRCVECNNGEFSIYFYHKLDCDSLNDGGLVQYSTNDGTTWDNIINCSFCNLINFYDTNDSITSMDDVGFNKSVSDWEMSGILLNSQENASEIDFRFVFSSDSSDNAKLGWSIDNFSVGSSTVMVPENITTNEIELFPNPITDISVSYLKDPVDIINSIAIYDITGKTIITEKNILCRQYLLHRNDFYPGLYIYTIETVSNRHLFGKFIVE